MKIAENFLSIRVSDGGGVYSHLPKGFFFFSKNGRGLGFSDTKGRWSRIMPVTNRFGKKMRNYIKQPQVKK